jgi:branched-chain amino acid transport system substrate-binding protein
MNKPTKIIIGIIVAIIVIAGIWYGVSKKPEPVKKEEKVIKIGAMADLSGNYSQVLRGIPRGTELAVEELKKSLKNVKIELVMEDIKSCDTKEAVTVMNKFVSVDKVDFVVGGTCSNTTLAAAPIAEQTKTVLISPSSSAEPITYAGEYVFRTYISDALRAKEAGKLAYTLGKKKMAIITDISNDATVKGSEGTRKEFASLGGIVVTEEKITKDQLDFRTIITKIKNANPDVLLISITGPNQIALVAKQLKESGVNIQLISPFETVEDSQVIKVAGNAVEGLIYIMPGNPPETEKYKALQKAYQEKYKEEEMPSYVAEAYDAVMLGVKAVLASNGTKEDIKNKLFEVSKTYEGVSGNVTFDENGDVTKPVMFKTIKNSQFVPYEK